jgi:hypothetical protein
MTLPAITAAMDALAAAPWLTVASPNVNRGSDGVAPVWRGENGPEAAAIVTDDGGFEHHGVLTRSRRLQVLASRLSVGVHVDLHTRLDAVDVNTGGDITLASS